MGDKKAKSEFHCFLEELKLCHGSAKMFDLCMWSLKLFSFFSWSFLPDVSQAVLPWRMFQMWQRHGYTLICQDTKAVSALTKVSTDGFQDLIPE